MDVGPTRARSGRVALFQLGALHAILTMTGAGLAYSNFRPVGQVAGCGFDTQ
jgi:hypothetical protein